MTQATLPAHPPASEHQVQMADGTDIFYRAWIPAAPTNRAVVMFHRGHEHSGRLADVVAALHLQDTAVFAWDARGHGRSAGDRGYAPSFGEMVRDVDTFVRHVCAHHGFAMQDIVVLAHSVGAVTVTTWVHDYAPRIRGLVLATPAFRVKLYVPLAIPGLRLLQRLRGGRKSFVKSYVKARMLTHDVEQARRYDADPLIARAIAVNILLEMHDTARRVVADAGAIRTPTLLLTGGRDWVVRQDVQRRFFARLGSPDKAMQAFPGMYHDILHEQDRAPVLDCIRGFIERMFDAAPAQQPLLDADRAGFTYVEHARLLQPPAPLSPKGLGYALQNLVMRTVGRLSRGISLGYRTGFDSGQSLDYVYENRARGALLVGRWIDRAYLSSAGWRGIRQRKVNLGVMLSRAMRAVAQRGYPVQLLDVATGAGRYVLDTIQALPDIEVRALLRDNTPANLETGRELARRMGLDCVRYEPGDAFDAASMEAVEPSPNVGVVSGLYELFADNEMVLRSLRGLAQALRAGAGQSGGEAWLVYTGQPWHPQLEMIARLLPNREGAAWVMRRRTQAEMDDLVREAGFEKVAMAIDDDGIFTVSLARIGS